MLNPSPMNVEIFAMPLEYADYLILNEIEAAAILGAGSEKIKKAGKPDGERLLGLLLEKFPGSKIVLTLGGDGSLYGDREMRYKQGIVSVKAVDTTAAGDTFTGYFISSVIDGMPVQDGLKLAAKASAIAVSRPGATASIPLRSEVVKEKSNGKI